MRLQADVHRLSRAVADLAPTCLGCQDQPLRVIFNRERCGPDAVGPERCPTCGREATRVRVAYGSKAVPDD